MLPRTVQDTEGRDHKSPAASASAPTSATDLRQQGHPREYDGNKSEILGNIVDNTLRFSSTSIPNKCSLTSTDGLPFGFIASPFAEPSDSSRWLRRSPERCQECGAYRNLFIVIELKTGRWACNFCGTINSSEDVKSREAIDACRELRDAVVEYVDPSASSYSSGPVAQPPCVHIFVLDSTIRPKDLEEAKRSVAQAIHTLPPDDMIGLVTFDGVVRVFDMAREEAGFAQVLLGVESPSPESLNALGESAATLAAPVHACAATFCAVVNAVQAPVRGRAKARARCVGPAVEVAVAVAGGCQVRPPPGQAERGLAPPGGRARVLVLLGGEPTVGPGAVPSGGPAEAEAEAAEAAAEYWALVGERGRRLGVAVDVLVSSMVGVGVRRLQGLAGRTGGEVVGHSSFGEAMARDLACAAGRFAGAGGVVDVHASRGVRVLHMLGPLVPPATKEELEAAEDLPNLSLSPAVEARHGYTVLYDLEGDVNEEYVFFQVVAAWSGRGGERILRVSTARVAVTSNTAALLQSVDADVVAALLGKEAVMRARSGEPLPDVRARVEARLRAIATTWGDQVQVTLHGRFPTVPPQLASLPAALFHLLHGPVLGSILNDADDVDLIHQLLLHASLADSLRIIRPTLLAVAFAPAPAADPAADPAAERGPGTLDVRAVPLETLSLLPDRVLLLDHHTHVFLWSGRLVAGPEHAPLRAAARGAAAAWAAGRFPAPEVQELVEDGSMARWLVCRLNPSHRDGGAAAGGGGAAGLLAAVAGAVRGALERRFAPTDDESLREWLLRVRVAV